MKLNLEFIGKLGEEVNLPYLGDCLGLMGSKPIPSVIAISMVVSWGFVGRIRKKFLCIKAS